MLYAVVMAGGSGTRFWPESRRLRPKQLLQLLGTDTLLRQTVDRLRPLIPEERTVVVTAGALAESVANELPELPSENILAEPCGRDTAACIGLAALWVLQSDPNAVMVVLPADHFIQPADGFQRALTAAARLIGEKPEALVTLGAQPQHPATGFGYIERGDALPDGGGTLYEVKAFREKPELALAEHFVANGNYYWNCGIFIWRAARILEALEQFAPEVHEALARLAPALGTADEQAALERVYPEIPRISIDRAVMEKAGGVFVFEAPFQWEDVGNWESLARLEGSDSEGNCITGQHGGLDTSDCIVRAQPGALVATVGVSNLIIVQTADAILVADRNRQESFRELNALLRERGYEVFL
jgi:mannose-1-phosphate guanylyltransferase